MPKWTDLTTGRRRAAALAAHFDSAFSRLREDDSWWPNTKKHSAWVLVRVREFGPERVVKDPVLRGWLLKAMGEWRATRSGVIEPRRFAKHLMGHDFLGALHEASGIQLSEFDSAAHGPVIARLFEGLEGIKSSQAQLVATSKTLYHLLPELIVPFDNQVTCGFFGWRNLPTIADQAWLTSIYSILGEIARGVGSDALESLGQPGWPLDRSVANALRIGQARVVDFGMEGYQRSRGEDWYVG
jgi:hypothetical protein